MAEKKGGGGTLERKSNEDSRFKCCQGRLTLGGENENENTEASGKVEIESEAKNENNELSPLCLKGCHRSSASSRFKALFL